MPAKLNRSFVVCLSMLLACSAVLAQAPQARPAPNQAGVIVLVEGSARLSPGGAAPRQAKVGDVVNEGDLLASGKDGEVHVKMQDTGFIVLRPNSRVQVESYRADGGDDDNGILRLVSGGLRSISGWIGKFNTARNVVRAGTVTIGIRGTDHEVRYIPEGSTEGEPGVYDRVFAGETYIQTPTERTAIAQNQAGFASSRPRQRPRLLAEIPGFFRQGPHEAEINQKHAEIQRQIDQRREERRKVIAEKRAALEAARTKVKDSLEQNKAAAEQAKQTAQERRAEAQAKREELQRDIKAAKELREDVQARRKALDEVLKTGQITRPELREQRKTLQEKQKALAQAEESIKQRRKALQEAADAQIDERFNTTQERQKALYDQRLEAREKRKSLEEERESAAEELKALRQQESKRYREELKKDRKSGDPKSPD